METVKAFAAVAPAFIAVVMVLQFVIERSFTARDIARERKRKLSRKMDRDAQHRLRYCVCGYANLSEIDKHAQLNRGMRLANHSQPPDYAR